MSEYILPALVGLLLALGVLLVVSALDSRRPTLARRAAQGSAMNALKGPSALEATGGPLVAVMDAIGSTTASVRRRLLLLGRQHALATVRLQQVVAALAGAVIMASALTPFIVEHGATAMSLLLMLLACLIGALTGASLVDQQLSWRARARQRRIELQVPDASELLALALGAGESVPDALERVCTASSGELAEELRTAVAQVRLGTPTTKALADLAARTEAPALDRLCRTLMTAMERGSPLAQVLHDQAKDIRESTRAALIEEGGQREIAMLFPVVFLIMPITVLFALYPGLVALSMTP